MHKQQIKSQLVVTLRVATRDITEDCGWNKKESEQKYLEHPVCLIWFVCRVFWVLCSRLHVAPWCQHQDRKPELPTGKSVIPLFIGVKCTVEILTCSRPTLSLCSRVCSIWSKSVRRCLRTWKCWTTRPAFRSTTSRPTCWATSATTSPTPMRGELRRTTPGQHESATRVYLKDWCARSSLFMMWLPQAGGSKRVLRWWPRQRQRERRRNLTVFSNPLRWNKESISWRTRKTENRLLCVLVFVYTQKRDIYQTCCSFSRLCSRCFVSFFFCSWSSCYLNEMFGFWKTSAAHSLRFRFTSQWAAGWRAERIGRVRRKNCNTKLAPGGKEKA